MQLRALNAALRVCFLLAPFARASAQGTPDLETAFIDVEKGAVIAFLPLSLRSAQDRDANSAPAHVRSAMDKTMQCVGKSFVSYHTVFADRIVIRWLGGEEAFEVGPVRPLVGALLFRTGSNPRILFAGGGPEALGQMLPRAAGEYFGKKCAGG
jgi:hypothetical protein